MRSHNRVFLEEPTTVLLPSGTYQAKNIPVGLFTMATQPMVNLWMSCVRGVTSVANLRVTQATRNYA